MLVLSRKPGERIFLDGGIVLTVTRIAGGRVWLGLDAPPAVKILREEIAPAEAGETDDAPTCCRFCASPKLADQGDGHVRCGNCGALYQPAQEPTG